MYIPESLSVSSDIVKTPSWTFILFSSQAPPIRFQEIIGIVPPVAEQFTDSDPPVKLKTLYGGLLTNFGADQTNRVVTAECSLKRLLALHSYGPVSFLSALVSVNNPRLLTTLCLGKTAVNFLHVTTGAGKPVTRHLGKVTFCPVFVWVGPAASWTRGMAGIESN